MNLFSDGADSPGKGVMAIEEFTALAGKLAAIGMYREAIALYETAANLYPDNIALKLNLNRLREDKRKADRSTLQSLEGEISRKRGADDRTANQCLGLGYLHYKRGDMEKAQGFFETANRLNPNQYLSRLYLGRIFMSRNEADKSIRELESARDLNPFSEEIQSLLGGLYMEKQLAGKALEAFVDALILSGTADVSRHPFYNQNIKQLLAILPASRKETLTEFIRERTRRFLGAAENLERTKRAMTPAGSRTASLHTLFAQRLEIDRERSEVMQRAAVLRKFDIFSPLSDDELYRVAREGRRVPFKAGDTILTEGEGPLRLLLIEFGTVEIVKDTPFGPFHLATFGRNDILGELNIIDGIGHSAHVMALAETSCFVFEKRDLEALWAEKQSVMVACYAHFWRTLSRNIRSTNELMKRFFTAEANRAPSEPHPEKHAAQAEKIEVDVKQKLSALKQHGLSADEILVLGSLSTEEKFREGDLIFLEGDPGDKLYIILDGKVRISKQIPGVGEEALAILEKGAFFGEMAVVDGSPRSADARAHTPETTVFSINKESLEQSLQSDVGGSVEFLKILCKILSHRLREINATIYNWWLLSGGNV